MKKITYICDFCGKVIDDKTVRAFQIGTISCLDEFIPDKTIEPWHFHSECMARANQASKAEPEPEKEERKLPKTREEQDELILKLYNDGLPFARISEAVGLHYNTIKGRLQKLGVDIK